MPGFSRARVFPRVHVFLRDSRIRLTIRQRFWTPIVYLESSYVIRSAIRHRIKCMARLMIVSIVFSVQYPMIGVVISSLKTGRRMRMVIVLRVIKCVCDDEYFQHRVCICVCVCVLFVCVMMTFPFLLRGLKCTHWVHYCHMWTMK